MIPHYRHPDFGQTCLELYDALVADRENKRGTIKKVTQIGNELFEWGSRTFVMGILNVTPDSFSDGGLFNTIDAAVTRAQEMVKEGVDIIDIGGMSSRPHSTEIPVMEEIERVVPVISAIRRAGINIPISIDTYRASVAEEAIKAGANLVNDISGGLRDTNMFEMV